MAHDYSDHVSILKFIERNWGLPTITERSRDNLPDPIARDREYPYVPTNGPAVDDLFSMFDFDHDRDHGIIWIIVMAAANEARLVGRDRLNSFDRSGLPQIIEREHVLIEKIEQPVENMR